MELNISNIIGVRSVAYHDEGLIILEKLESAIISNTSVKLSFEGLRNAASQFLHTAIGTLYLKFPEKKVDGLLTYNYGEIPNLKNKIDDIKWIALHSKEYDEFVENAIR